MSQSQNPFGLHTITPYLVVDDAVGQVNFLKEIFDATSRGPLRYREDGSVQHVEVTIGDSVVMIGEPMDDSEAMPGMLYTYVEDCDATYAKAIEGGAISVTEPADYSHGDRYGGVKDLNGNIWWIVTHIGQSG